MDRWEKEAQLSGITRNGTFDRWFRSPTRTVPHPLSLEEVDGEPQLVWEQGCDHHPVKSDKGILRDFVRLERGSKESVHRFAKRHGVLALCFAENLPVGHFRRPLTDELICLPLGMEPIRIWRAYAKEARAMISIASELRRGRHGELSDWVDLHAASFERVFEDPPGDPDRWGPIVAGLSDEGARGWLSRHVQDWIRDGGVRAEFVWEGELPEVRLGGSGLFSELARQLVFGVSATSGWVTCADCGSPFFPSRKPASNRKSFCERCGKTAALKHAKRDQRARDRGRAGRSTK